MLYFLLTGNNGPVSVVMRPGASCSGAGFRSQPRSHRKGRGVG